VGAPERDGRQGSVSGLRCGVRDIPFQEPLQDGGSRIVKHVLNCAEGHIVYKDMHTVLTEAVAGFANLYA